MAKMNGARLSQDRQCTIASQAFTLRFSTKAVAALQDLWGIPANGAAPEPLTLDGVIEKVAGATRGMDIVMAGDLLWASLRAYHQEVSRDDVSTMIDDAGLRGLPMIIGELNLTLEAAMPPPSEVAAARPPKGKAKVLATTN